MAKIKKTDHINASKDAEQLEFSLTNVYNGNVAQQLWKQFGRFLKSQKGG
jgi:hypothetical protein